jgi:drug/metabolite transporter (DMT)-like permease
MALDIKHEIRPATTSTHPETSQTEEFATNRFGFTTADFYLFLCVLIWAVNIPFIKMVLEYIDPLGTSLIRFSVAGVFIVAFVLLKERNLKVAWRDVPLIVVGALIGITGNQIFFVYALQNSTSSEVSLLMASAPTFAAIFAWIFAGEKITRNYWLSFPLALVGVSLIILTAQGVRLTGSFLGVGLALLTAASWACYTVIIRPLMSRYSTMKVSAYMTVIGAVTILPFGLPQIHPEKLATAPAHIWLILLYSTFGAVLLTNILWYIGVKRLGAQRTAFYAYLQPFLGVVAAFIILGENLIGWSMIIYRRQKTGVRGQGAGNSEK